MMKWQARIPTSRLTRQQGAELAEFALLFTSLPVFLVLIFGVMDFSRAMYAYHSLSSAARQATRFALVRGNSCTGFPTACPADADDIKTYVSNEAGIGLDSTTLFNNTSPKWGPPPSNPTSCGGIFSSTRTATNSAPGCVVQVQVQYPLTFSFPFLPSSTVMMSSKSQIVISQ